MSRTGQATLVHQRSPSPDELSNRVTAGTKTIEVRVKHPHLAVGVTFRFRVKGTEETCDVKVLRVNEYLKGGPRRPAPPGAPQ